MYIINDLIFRKPDIDDLDDLYQLKNEDSSRQLLGGFNLGYSKEDIKNWILFHQKCTTEAFFVIAHKDNNQIIGHVALYNIDYRIGKAEYAILISEEFRGNGLGKKASDFILDIAFNQLNIRRLVLSVLASNKAAINLYKKIGFIEEGLLKEDQYKEGKYHDVVLMALMK